MNNNITPKPIVSKLILEMSGTYSNRGNILQDGKKVFTIETREEIIDVEKYISDIVSCINIHEELVTENKELRERCSMNYGGGFTQAEVDLQGCRDPREREQNTHESLLCLVKEMGEALEKSNIYLNDAINGMYNENTGLLTDIHKSVMQQNENALTKYKQSLI